MRPDRPDQLAPKVAAALDRLARARRIHRQALATRYGLTPLQIELLHTLTDGPPPRPTVGALAVETGVAQPTATDSLLALERKGLVERHPDDRDARRTVYRLTTTGRDLVETLVADDAGIIRAIESLPVSVQTATLDALLTVIARLVDSGEITVDRTCLTCHHYRNDGTTHYCSLLDAELPPDGLRVNCPEHQPRGEQAVPVGSPSARR